MTASFLHEHCKADMCDDCVSIAEEYQQLLELRTKALVVAQHEAERAKKELEQVKRQAAMWEELAKAGVGNIIGAWMDKEIEKLFKVQP